MFYKVIVEYGHLGAGRGFEMTRFVKGRDPLHVFEILRTMPRVKKKTSLRSVKLLKEVTEAEYLSGRKHMKEFRSRSPYFN